MEFGPGKILVVEAGAQQREHIAELLTEAGYQVSSHSAGALRTVLEVMPDVVVLGANPPQLDCCDLLADIKRSEHVRHIRVIMVAPLATRRKEFGVSIWVRTMCSRFHSTIENYWL